MLSVGTVTSDQVGVVPVLTSVQVPLVVAFNCVHVELVPGFKLAQLGVVGIVTSDHPVNTSTSSTDKVNSRPVTGLSWLIRIEGEFTDKF